ncbi:hypothetical protein CVU75_00010 [Candidatus Dependentiae bacterium HGW-Dependentiae-1]|nr:MAG: hypothetical protein CVU75_00010 [Candidatus Dependentiae bacterium HGW-Dependentiae-1]
MGPEWAAKGAPGPARPKASLLNPKEKIRVAGRAWSDESFRAGGGKGERGSEGEKRGAETRKKQPQRIRSKLIQKARQAKKGAP